jgi:biopolymer transport protein ExbB
MRFRGLLVVAAISAWLIGTAGAQAPGAPTGTAASATDSAKISVTLQMLYKDMETTTVEKDGEVEVVASVKVEISGQTKANATVALDIADELSISNRDDVRIKKVYIDNTGTGDRFAAQTSMKSQQRLRFAALEGETSLSATQKIKWVMVFKNNAANAPFSAMAALTIPPSSTILTKDRAELKLKVKSALNVQQLWKDGGAFMWPLGISLIIAIAFGLERLWTLTFAKIDAQAFFAGLSKAMKDGGVEAAIKVCDATRGPVAAVIREGLLRVDQGLDNVEKAIESAGAVEGSFLQRGMVVLASVTSLAPMIGFLGTVWGMVLAFRAIAEAGDVKPSIVADGISQALITTATGLVIAVIVQSVHNFLISRINRIVIDMEETSTLLVDLLIEEGVAK